jgi:hypothetical protein
MPTSDYSYSWKKVYAVNTVLADPVEVGDHIEVDASTGSSIQEVRSVTVMSARNGNQYKTLLLREVKD